MLIDSLRFATKTARGRVEAARNQVQAKLSNSELTPSDVVLPDGEVLVVVPSQQQHGPAQVQVHEDKVHPV